MEDKDLKWRKASYSSNGGTDCVEVAGHDSRVMVRDTKDCQGPVLRFSAGVWRRFADHVKADASLASDPQAGPGGACRGIPVFRGCPIAVSGVPVLGDIRAVPRWRVVAVAGCRDTPDPPPSPDPPRSNPRPAAPQPHRCCPAAKVPRAPAGPPGRARCRAAPVHPGSRASTRHQHPKPGQPGQHPDDTGAAAGPARRHATPFPELRDSLHQVPDLPRKPDLTDLDGAQRTTARIPRHACVPRHAHRHHRRAQATTQERVQSAISRSPARGAFLRRSVSRQPASACGEKRLCNGR
jgi:hypothetical protein